MLYKLLIALATLASAFAAPLTLRSGTCAGLACGGPFLNLSLPASLPPLPYAYNALEPFIIEDIMVRDEAGARGGGEADPTRVLRSAFTTTLVTSRTSPLSTW